jgi:hypothetical protein
MPFHHRHVLHVNEVFSTTFGAVPQYAPVFACKSTDAGARLRGNFEIPTLLGTDSANFADSAVVVELNNKLPALRDEIGAFRKELLTVDAMTDRLRKPGTNFLERELNKFLDNATVRSDVYALAGHDDVQFIGVTTAQQNPGPYIHQGLMEVQTCVEGVCRWRPYVEPGALELYRQYAPGDPVFCAPPGGYAEQCIGTVVDFLDQNEMRLRLKL